MDSRGTLSAERESRFEGSFELSGGECWVALGCHVVSVGVQGGFELPRERALPKGNSRGLGRCQQERFSMRTSQVANFCSDCAFTLQELVQSVMAVSHAPTPEQALSSNVAGFVLSGLNQWPVVALASPKYEPVSMCTGSGAWRPHEEEWWQSVRPCTMLQASLVEYPNEAQIKAVRFLLRLASCTWLRVLACLAELSILASWTLPCLALCGL
eukprot:scaffold19828_cov19-Tisochrysis_lutea.AAC.1